MKEQGSFWQTVPGILTGLAALITAVGGCIAIIAASPRIADLILPAPATTTIINTPAQPTVVGVPTFSGLWQGPDPDDGSTITVSLTQTGSKLESTFSDTYSGKIKPGYQGNGLGTVLSATSAQISFDLSRVDGASAQIKWNARLSDQGNTLTLSDFIINGTPTPTEPPIVLRRR